MRTSLRLIGGKKIESPKNDTTRPTTLMVREAIFNILNRDVIDSNWLDLYSGSGAISCEAYNHGARKIVAIERSKKNAQICKNNLHSLQNADSRALDVEVICQDVFAWIKSSKSDLNISKVINLENNQFDYIYLDPPYRNNFNYSLLEEIFKSNLVKDKSIVIYEHSKTTKLKESIFWKVKDIRVYGQTKLAFLIKV